MVWWFCRFDNVADDVVGDALVDSVVIGDVIDAVVVNDVDVVDDDMTTVRLFIIILRSFALRHHATTQLIMSNSGMIELAITTCILWRH